MVKINDEMYRNIKEQYKYLHKCKKLLDLIYDCYVKEDFDMIRRLLDIYGVDIVQKKNLFL